MITDVFDRLAAIDTDAIFIKVMNNPGIQQQLIDWNQEQLTIEGVDAKGDATGEYAPSTIQHKIKMGQPYDHVTLKDTGAFYDSMRVLVGDDGVVISGDMQKPGKDLEKQWPDALGLTPESIEAIRPLFNQLFMEEYQNQVRDILNGEGR